MGWLADYLRRARAREPFPVLPHSLPAETAADWPDRFEAGPTRPLAEILGKVLVASNHLHHPRAIGHQVAAPLPAAALCDLVGSLLNNSMAVYEMGPVVTAMERSVIAWMARVLGLPADADGVLTSGGSAGNLTALLAARAAHRPDARRDGTDGRSLAVLVSAQAHYSIARAVQIMGWGQGGAVPVPVDDRFKLRPEALEGALATARAAGREPIAVVASACTTATGSYDPLGPVADFAARHGLWMHVDGAHGAAAALVPELRPRVAGIERADSVVWDAHKMLLMPSLVTGLVFRDGARSYETFSQEAGYLLGSDPKDEWFNLGHRTLECTKSMMSLKLYACLAAYGTDLFAAHVRRTFAMARTFAALVREAPDFELASEPEANIVCFRHRAKDVYDLDWFQDDLRQKILKSGRFYLVRTRLPSGVWLRGTIMNPQTAEQDLQELLAAIRTAARSG